MKEQWFQLIYMMKTFYRIGDIYMIILGDRRCPKINLIVGTFYI